MNSFYSEEELAGLGLKSYGINVLISRNARIYGASRISIGNNVRIDDFCILSGKITLGSYVHISAASCLFAGDAGIEFEDYAGASGRTAIYAESDDYSGMGMTTPVVPEKYRLVTGAKVIVKRFALIGSGCTVLPGVVVGEGVAVGSMSLVNRSLDDWGIYAGIPCRRIKERHKNIIELEKQFREERNSENNNNN